MELSDRSGYGLGTVVAEEMIKRVNDKKQVIWAYGLTLYKTNKNEYVLEASNEEHQAEINGQVYDIQMYECKYITIYDPKLKRDIKVSRMNVTNYNKWNELSDMDNYDRKKYLA